MQINRGENVGDLWSGDIELGQQFDFAACNFNIDVQFARDGHKIFLQDLQ